MVGASWRHEGLAEGFRVSESTAERFALFTIIVLGEVIVGVVDGLTGAGDSWTTTAVGCLYLGIGFGIWWNYFDFVGRRPPRPGLGVRGLWLVTHLPLSMSVAAIGAGMVNLIEHASDDRTPTASSWLIGASIAMLCVSLAVIVALMPDRPGAKFVPHSLAAAALASLVAAALHPAALAARGPSSRCCSRLSGSRRSSGMPDWVSPSSRTTGSPERCTFQAAPGATGRAGRRCGPV